MTTAQGFTLSLQPGDKVELANTNGDVVLTRTVKTVADGRVFFDGDDIPADAPLVFFVQPSSGWRKAEA